MQKTQNIMDQFLLILSLGVRFSKKSVVFMLYSESLVRLELLKVIPYFTYITIEMTFEQKIPILFFYQKTTKEKGNII